MVFTPTVCRCDLKCLLTHVVTIIDYGWHWWSCSPRIQHGFTSTVHSCDQGFARFYKMGCVFVIVVTIEAFLNHFDPYRVICDLLQHLTNVNDISIYHGWCKELVRCRYSITLLLTANYLLMNIHFTNGHTIRHNNPRIHVLTNHLSHPRHNFCTKTCSTQGTDVTYSSDNAT
jgi:hypothetical protein